MPLLTVLKNARAYPLVNDINLAVVGAGEELGSPEFWWKILISAFLVLLGGVFAGYVLTLSTTKLRVINTIFVSASCQTNPRTHGPR